AGLLIKSFLRMNARPAGFDPEHILVAKLQFSGAHYREISAQRAYIDELLSKLQSISGVRAVTIATPDARYLPKDLLEGISTPPDFKPPPIVFDATSAAYQKIVGLSLRKGRWLADAESEPVVAIN